MPRMSEEIEGQPLERGKPCHQARRQRSRPEAWPPIRGEVDWSRDRTHRRDRGPAARGACFDSIRPGRSRGRGRTMEILGIGTDIIECPRIGKMIEQHGELFLRRVYTEREIRYCQARKHAIEHFAGRWAAKEAILKEIGTGWTRGVAWTYLEVRKLFSGAPTVQG